MAEFMGWQQLQAVVAGVVAVVAMFAWLQMLARGRPSNAGKFPRGPRAWPIVGHLPLLMKSLPHKVLGDLYFKQGYGPIVGLRLGSARHRAVVVSSPALAKEVLLTHDKIFANRVHYVMADQLSYGYNTGLFSTTYNPRSRWTRRLVTQELLSAKSMQNLSHVRYNELRKLLRRLHQASSSGTQAVDVGEAVGHMTVDSTARLIHSKSLVEVASDLPELIRCAVLECRPVLGDFFPSLSFLDVVRKLRMRRLHHSVDKIFDVIIEERKRLMARELPCNLPNDFLQVLLSARKGNDEVAEENALTDREVKALIVDFLGGSYHTSTGTIEWALAELLRGPEYLHKLREEVERVTRSEEGRGAGSQNLVTDEDVQKMPFLDCFVKEVLRLHPPSTLLPARLSSADCTIDKYFLPKGTQAIVNVWAIARDPAIWEKPESFWPDRFESTRASYEMGGEQHYAYLPFGSGRRMCPGMRLGLSTVQVTVANLVKFFEWELPHGVSPSSMDMSEEALLACHKKLPVLAIPKLRQSSLP